MSLRDAALAAFQHPDERHILDFFEGPVQAIYVHDTHGAFYLYAVALRGDREREYCIRPLADRSVITEAITTVTLEEAEWWMRLALERMIPACGDGGVRVKVVDRAIVDASEMTAAELAETLPRSLDDLLGR